MGASSGDAERPEQSHHALNNTLRTPLAVLLLEVSALPPDGALNHVRRGHPALIERAIRNSVDNATKLSPQRSTIFVRVDAERNIIVEDCGPGVPDAQNERIFKRFWRADGPRVSGSGIGLTLVRRIAFLHGGDIRVEDRPGGGARFVVTLGPTARDVIQSGTAYTQR